MLRQGLKLARRSVRTVPARGFAEFKHPDLPNGIPPDGIFRRPQTPLEDSKFPELKIIFCFVSVLANHGCVSQLGEDQELWIDDAQVPEPAYDVDPNVGGLSAFLQILAGFGVISLGFLITYKDPKETDRYPGSVGNPIMYQEEYEKCRYPGGRDLPYWPGSKGFSLIDRDPRAAAAAAAPTADTEEE
eukprot:1030221-Amorphochlora_amoeboformis.AAC.1